MLIPNELGDISYLVRLLIISSEGAKYLEHNSSLILSKYFHDPKLATRHPTESE